MAHYESPELFEVGSVEGVVLGDKTIKQNGDSADSTVSSYGISVLDID